MFHSEICDLNGKNIRLMSQKLVIRKNSLNQFITVGAYQSEISDMKKGIFFN